MDSKSASSRSVLVRSTHSPPITGITDVPRSCRALRIVLGDFTRAWLDVLDGATLGQPSANHASITSANVVCRVRTGSGAADWARKVSSSSRSAWAAAFSARSTFRRESATSKPATSGSFRT